MAAAAIWQEDCLIAARLSMLVTVMDRIHLFMFSAHYGAYLDLSWPWYITENQ
jgi:hypothetical protein